MRHIASLLAALLLGTATLPAQDGTEETFRQWALTPPMGWNSWDCYYSTVNESLVLQNAAYLRDSLLSYGWEYVVVDIRWYANHPSWGGGNYNQSSPDCVLDAHGRYLPSPTRFPSALDADGNNTGFKALADSIHAMGLKFGIHIMRGLPKYILDDPDAYTLAGDSTTTGSKWSRVYSSTTPACTWLADNLTVRDNDWGQLYYNSLADLYAGWGVDFIKVDDMSRPFYTDEIRMLRNAIDQCGRPIVLSLSPGKTDLSYAESCLEMANMWRMMDDLWDSWTSVKAVFDEANDWQPYYRPGNYADCDMLPLGHISMTVADAGYASADSGRDTQLTEDEQTTLMTLWGVAHSPLFFGGELTMNDAFTNSLLTNEAYLWMHHYAVDSHRLQDDDGQIAWTSIDPATGDRYLALFSTGSGNGWIYDDAALWTSQLLSYTTDGHAEDVSIDLPAGIRTLALVWDDGGDNYNYDHGDWLNPTFISEGGYEVPLTGDFVYYTYTNSYYNVIREDVNVYGTGSMAVLDETYSTGFSADANALLLAYVPDSITAFRATVALDDTGIGQTGSTTTMRFYLFDGNPLVSEDYSPVAANAHTGAINRQRPGPATMEADISGATTLTIVIGDLGDGYTYDRADLINPVLIDAEGNETSLTSLSYASYTSDWGSVHVNENVEGGTLSVGGTTYSTGLGLNAYGVLTYDLPADAGYVTFSTLCGLDDSALSDNPSSTSGCTIEFMAFADNTADSFAVDLTDLGLGAGQSVTIHDIWTGEEAGTYSGEGFSADVPLHGARLFRLTPERSTSTSITLSTSTDGDTLYVITASVSGSPDSTSYVLWYIDGQPVGSTSASAGTCAYYAAGLTEGEHTVSASYSGTATEASSQSAELTLVVAPTGIVSLSSCAGDADKEVITLSGRSLVATPHTPVHVYSPRGELVATGTTDASGQMSITLPAGTYVVTAAASAAKIHIP